MWCSLTLHCNHRLQRSSSGFLCLIADQKFLPDIFSQTLCLGRCFIFTAQTVLFAKEQMPTLQPLNVLTALGRKVQTEWWRNGHGLGVWGLESRAHLACKQRSTSLFATSFCQYLSLTGECYCLHKVKKVFLTAGSDASLHAPHKFLLTL